MKSTCAFLIRLKTLSYVLRVPVTVCATCYICYSIQMCCVVCVCVSVYIMLQCTVVYYMYQCPKISISKIWLDVPFPKTLFFFKQFIFSRFSLKMNLDNILFALMWINGMWSVSSQHVSSKRSPQNVTENAVSYQCRLTSCVSGTGWSGMTCKGLEPLSDTVAWQALSDVTIGQCLLFDRNWAFSSDTRQCVMVLLKYVCFHSTWSDQTLSYDSLKDPIHFQIQ